MALGALGVAAAGAGLGSLVGSAATSGKKTKLLTTKQNITTSFLDPAQLKQILNGLTRAEETGRGDISQGVQDALAVLTGDTGYRQRQFSIRQQAENNAMSALAQQQRKKYQDILDGDYFRGRQSEGYAPNMAEAEYMRERGLTSRDQIPYRSISKEQAQDMISTIDADPVAWQEEQMRKQWSNDTRRRNRGQTFDEYKDKTLGRYMDESALYEAEGQLRQSESSLFDTENADGVDPYLRSTQALNLGALNQMAAFSGLEGSDGQVALSPQEIQARLEQTPGYQFRYNQGMQGVERAGSARGLLESGAILKGLTEFGQGLASQEFGAEHARLATLAGQTMNQALTGASQQQQNTMTQAQLLAGQGSQLAGVTQQAAQQRGNALLSGGVNTQKQNQNELFRGLNRI